jgi:predicted nucleotidyltransferase
MEFPDKIVGVEKLKLRDMFKDFVGDETVGRWQNGKPVYSERKMTVDLIAGSLGISSDEAKHIQRGLVTEDLIDPKKLTPTPRGMALAQYIDRPRMPRAEAKNILGQIYGWAERTNAEDRENERVRVKAIYLFGSLERGEADVGDIDLFVLFTPSPLSGELEPEDIDRQDELSRELAMISEYISLHSELEQISMLHVPSWQIFPPGADERQNNK